MALSTVPRSRPSSQVQAQLRSVTAIQATEWSFAALRQDGTGDRATEEDAVCGA